MRNPHKKIKFSSQISHLNLTRAPEPGPVAPFALDLVNECLRRGEQRIPLTRKAFAVLRYLVDHPGRLVSKQELLDAVWPQTYVSEGVLTNCILRLREALEDDARSPRFIETVHGRGYRLITPLATNSQPGASSTFQVSGSQSTIHNPLRPDSSTGHAMSVVGRAAELQQLHSWLDKAMSGERQVIFVRGEAGIGKTTVMEAFLEQINQGARGWRLETSPSSQASSLKSQASRLWIGRGQCIEHHGAGEAYMPVLEALGRLCREPEGERLITLLSQHAPTWLVQMPALLNAVELEALQRRVQGTTRERMLREMAEALETVTTERPLVLRLEDLHWSDVSTLDLLAVLARRRERARLLVLGTYRPVEILRNEHPLRAVTQELQLHRQCEELRLGFLTEEDVSEYLAVRFAGSSLPAGLARVIHRRTNGNPLFMVNVVEDLITQGGLAEVEGRWVLKAAVEAVEGGVPESIQQMIEKQLERLGTEEQRVLEVASVAGVEFAAAAVAAGAEAEVDEIETICAERARRGHFVRAQGVSEWPDGTVTARYGFLHALYQSVLYERVPVGRRIGLHRRIGEREEVAYGNRTGEIAAELAMHFERGRDYRRAVQYLQQAGENAIQRSAHVEAISLLTKGLGLLEPLPATSERTRQELMLQLTLGVPLQNTKGFGAPEVGQAYTRAWELCQQLEEAPQLFPVLRGLSGFYIMRAEYQTARELGEQMLRLAQSVQDSALLLEAHHELGHVWYSLGELLPAREHFEQGIVLYDPQQHHSHAFRYGLDPGVSCLIYAAYVLWYLGYPDQAVKRIQEVVKLAQGLAHPLSLVQAHHSAAVVYLNRREAHAVQEQAEAEIALALEQGFRQFWTWGTIRRGWALVQQGRGEEGLTQLQEGLAALRATGALMTQTLFLATLAEAYGTVGQTEEGLTVLTEALDIVDKMGDRVNEAELYRLKGQLTLQSKVPGPKSQVEEAEECFLKAIDVAQRQSAKSLELRAVTSLARLWQHQGKKKKARRMLAEIYDWFTEGFDTADLKEARALLEELSGHHEAHQ
ncbi:MAG TPA: AAA family ATPase [Candidatus Binatia bacterium]|jgi:DNA-binding winged helix-turn-helix (wHTH) protein/tetratricopeptide (TPR) repeat protein|nr:AAA family ATPase [Candidatus Binatia bacterium]